MKDERGRKDRARENGMRWDSWDALASKKWVIVRKVSVVGSGGAHVLRSFLF